MSRRRVAVIGAGLTGLATAWHLRDDAEVTVWDATERVGGQIRTVSLAGVPFDVGADAYLVRRPEAEALVRAAGFGGDDLVVPATNRVLLWVRGRLRPLPDGAMLGAPTNLGALVRSGTLTPLGLARAAVEPLMPRRSVAGDRSVADLVGERFGREVVDTLVEPLLGGVYAGSAERLSAQAAATPIWDAAMAHRSVLLGLRAHRRKAAATDGRAVFATLRGGLSRLTTRLADDLGDRVHTGAGVEGLVRREAPGDGGRWELTVDGATVEADEVVLAVPAAPAAALLRTIAPQAAHELAGIDTASVAVVALAYRRQDALGVVRASGVLVPRGEGRLIKAVTLSSHKWPHQVHDDVFVVRASVGRIDDRRADALDDDTLAERVDAELRLALGLHAPAVEHVVVRWRDALAQYDVGHRARVARIEAAVDDLPGLHVAGASLQGIGLAARAAEAAALAGEIRTSGGTSPRGMRP